MQRSIRLFFSTGPLFKKMQDFGRIEAGAVLTGKKLGALFRNHLPVAIKNQEKWHTVLFFNSPA